MTKNLVLVSISILCLVLAYVVFVVGHDLSLFLLAARAAAHDVSTLSIKLQRVAVEAEQTLTIVKRYSDEQTEMFRQNQKSIKATIEVGAMLKGTLLSVNRLMIPRAMNVLEETSNAARGFNALQSDTNASLNVLLIPKIDHTLESLDTSLREITIETVKVLRSIDATVSDPAIKSSLKNIEKSSASLEASMRELPSVAKSLDKISKTSAKWQPWTITAYIFSALGRVFF